MKQLNSLWYTRHDGKVSGPFTATLVRSNLLLGRLSSEDEASIDQTHWQRIADIPELTEQATAQRAPANAEQLDERDGFDRRQQQIDDPTLRKQRQRERRSEESPETIQHRQLRTLILQNYRNRRQTIFWPLLIVVLMVIFSTLLAVLFPSQVPVSMPNCSAPPMAGVNWENCRLSNSDLSHQDLQRAKLRNSQLSGSNLMNANLDQAELAYTDLSFSNLSYSSMREVSLLGANLQGADLTNADLQGSNLTHADLRGAKLGAANLENTRLDNAIWTDGLQCAPNSFEQCVPLLR